MKPKARWAKGGKRNSAPNERGDVACLEAATASMRMTSGLEEMTGDWRVFHASSTVPVPYQAKARWAKGGKRDSAPD